MTITARLGAARRQADVRARHHYTRARLRLGTLCITPTPQQQDHVCVCVCVSVSVCLCVCLCVCVCACICACPRFRQHANPSLSHSLVASCVSLLFLALCIGWFSLFCCCCCCLNPACFDSLDAPVFSRWSSWARRRSLAHSRARVVERRVSSRQLRCAWNVWASAAWRNQSSRRFR